MKRYIRTAALVLALLALSGCHQDSSPSTDNIGTEHSTAAPSGWVTADGVTRYYLPDGTAVTGRITIGGSSYYFDENGTLQTGWATLSDGSYYFGADGVMVTGWLELDTHRYYLASDGRMVTGWQTVDGQQYYFLDSSMMARGEVEIDGKAFFFTSTGAQILVVNPWNRVPENYSVKLVKLPDQYGNNRYVSEDIYDDLMDMIYACEKAMAEKYAGTGKKAPTLWVRSANRTNGDQQALFDNKVARVKAQYPHLTQAEAEAQAATVVAPPGTSEHQLALAVDIVDTQLNALVEEQENLEGQQWLMEHCWEFGFILRYPKGTTDVTGIIYEPWHYRHVGKELAKVLHELGVPLETYLKNLNP